MAGSEKSGVLVSRPDLYEKALCLLVKTPWTPDQALEKLGRLWQAVGCDRLLRVSPKEHDAWTAAASHLPHAAAVCLVSVLADACSRQPLAATVAAGGFRDTTRIASGLPAMWADILLTNAAEVEPAIARLQKKLDRLSRLLRQGNRKGLEAELDKARAFRMNLNLKEVR
jgi:prephenate dehydrogenase